MDRNVINMANLQKLNSGARIAYMADLYDQTVKGLGGGSRKLEIEELLPAKFPLATLFMSKAKGGGNSFTGKGDRNWWFEWGEDSTPSTPLDRNVVTGATLASGNVNSTTGNITVVSSEGLKEGDVLVGFGEDSATGTTDREKRAYILITEVTSATVIVGKRLNVSGFIIKSGQKLYVIGSAYAELAEVSDPMYTIPTTKYGSCQIFKNSFKMSRRQKDFDTRYGNDYYHQMMKTAEDHKFQIEMALLQGYRPEGFGLPSVVGSTMTDGSSRPVTFTMGLEQAIGLGTDKFIDSGGTANARKIVWTKGNTTIEDFELAMDRIFEYQSGSSNTRYMWGGLEILSFMRGLARDNKIQIMPSKTTDLGIIVNKIETSAGILTFVQHPLMKGAFKNKFFIIDPSLVETYVAKPTSMHEQGKGVNSEVYHAEYITDLGMGVKNLPTHASGMIL